MALSAHGSQSQSLDQLHQDVRKRIYLFRDAVKGIAIVYRALNNIRPPTQLFIRLGRTNVGSRIVVQWKAPRTEWTCRCSEPTCQAVHVFAFRKTFYSVRSQVSLDLLDVSLQEEESFFRAVCGVDKPVHTSDDSGDEPDLDEDTTDDEGNSAKVHTPSKDSDPPSPSLLSQ